MSQLFFFVLVFIVPLAVYLLNAYNARRPTGIAGGVEPPKKAKTVKPRRAKAAPARGQVRRDCGRDWTHLCLSLVGARSACRWCTADPVEPTPFPRSVPVTEPATAVTPEPERETGPAGPTERPAPIDIIAEAEKILDDSRKE